MLSPALVAELKAITASLAAPGQDTAPGTVYTPNCLYRSDTNHTLEQHAAAAELAFAGQRAPASRKVDTEHYREQAQRIAAERAAEARRRRAEQNIYTPEMAAAAAANFYGYTDASEAEKAGYREYALAREASARERAATYASAEWRAANRDAQVHYLASSQACFASAALQDAADTGKDAGQRIRAQEHRAHKAHIAKLAAAERAERVERAHARLRELGADPAQRPATKPAPATNARRADTPCPTGRIYTRRSCTHNGAPYQPVVLTTCKLPTCAPCEAARAARLRDRWEPAISRFRSPAMLTLTAESGTDARERIDYMIRSLRRLAEFRLGKRGRAKLQRKAHEFIDSLADASLHGRTRDDWRAQIDAWIAYAERRAKGAKDTGELLKFRGMMRGVMSLESTHTANGWHFHFHGLMNFARFMPWPIMVAAWTIATRQTQFAGAHINAVKGDGLGELFKYALKPADAATLTTAQKQELIDGLYRRKRVFVFGRLIPAQPEPEPCPNCETLTCTCERITVAKAEDRTAPGVYLIPNFRDGQPVTLYDFIDTTRPELGLMWRSANNDDGQNSDDEQARMSRYFPDLDTNAGPAPPTGPPKPEPAEVMA